MAEDKPVHGLHKNVAKAATIREMCQSKGFQVLQEEIKKEKERVAEKMLDTATSNEDVIKYRDEVKVWVALEKILKKVMLTGEFSARNLAQLENLETSDTKSE